jgi:RNA polymerase sigma factor (sigma-70 family)
MLNARVRALPHFVAMPMPWTPPTDGKSSNNGPPGSTVTNSDSLNHWSREHVLQAMDRDQALARRFAESVLDRVQVEVGFTLRLLSRTAVGELVQHRDDLTQASMLYLYENGGKVLRSWDPAGGMSLSSFVGLVVRRRVFRIFRYKRSNPTAANSLPPADIDKILEAAPPALGSFEEEIAEASNLVAVRKCVNSSEISERDRRLYRAFYIEERPTIDISMEEKLSQDGIHQALKRMRDRIKHCLEKRRKSGTA